MIIFFFAIFIKHIIIMFVFLLHMVDIKQGIKNKVR